MDLIPEIVKRYSCRSYQDKPVEQDALDRVLEAARLAPSAKNMQEWRFVVVRDAQTRAKLVPACCDQAFVGQAPVVIACCAEQADYTMRCGQRAAPIDVAIAVEHMALQATREGLATCWIGAFWEDKVRALLNIPNPIAIIEMLVLGHPADSPGPKKREPIDTIVSYDTWGF